MSDDFIDRLVNHSDFIEEELSFVEPWSQIPPPPPVDAFEFEEDLADDPALADDTALALHLDLGIGALDDTPNRSHHTSAVDYSEAVNLDSSLEIPEYDFDFSDEADSDHASAAYSDESDDDTDGSIIGDW